MDDPYSYLAGILSPERGNIIIDQMVDLITKANIPFDAFAFRGFSGALVAAPLALRLNKRLVLVRKKDKELSHGNPIEGLSKDTRNIAIIDDFISSGETIRAIKKRILDAVQTNNPHYPPSVNFVAIFLWSITEEYNDKERMHGIPVFGIME